MRMADCHPDRPHLAKGMCESCYRVHRRKIRLAAMTDEEREALRVKERQYFTAACGAKRTPSVIRPRGAATQWPPTTAIQSNIGGARKPPGTA